MSTDDLYVKTYIAKFEGVLLDQVRKHVDGETRNALYTAALQDLQSKFEESERLASDLKSTLDQALSGLQAVTLEKDDLKIRYKQLESDFSCTSLELDQVKNENQRSLNKVAVSEHKLEELTTKLETAEANAVTIKNNYTSVLKDLEKFQTETGAIKDKKKKITTKESEWVDGN